MGRLCLIIPSLSSYREHLPVMESDGFVLYLNPTFSLDIFPRNIGSDFMCILPFNLSLKGDYEIALSHFSFIEKGRGGGALLTSFYICTDVVRHSIVGDKLIPVLYHFNTTARRNNKQITIEPASPIYIPIKDTDIGQLRLYILSQDGTLPTSVVNQVLMCKLLIRKVY